MKKTLRPNSADPDDMPEVDIKRAKVVGTGIYFRRMAAENHYIQLDPDVSKDFKSARDVNDALRVVQQLRKFDQSLRRKKSA